MKRTSARLQETSAVVYSEPTYATPSKSKSKKRKAESPAVPEVKDEPNEADATWDLDFSEIPGEEPVKRRKKKKKSKRIEPDEQELIEDIEIKEEHLEPEIEIKQENDSWPADKIKTLLQRMRTEIPENDTMKFTSRISKINWNRVKFESFSASECEKMWKRIQEKSRCYRILEEIIADAEDELQKPSSTLNLNLQKRRHPDRPTKPLTSFMLFFLDKKEKVQRENPGANGAEVAKKVAELWKSLNPKKLDKYKNKAQKLKEEYDRKMAKFYEEHPECVEEPKKKKKGNQFGFEKPKSAFQIYVSSCRDSEKLTERMDDKQFYEHCKTEWKSMPEKDKVFWIKAAQEEEDQFRSNMKKYESEHPGFVPPTIKTLITKNDRNVLENFKGKPKKPPCNAYSLFSVIMLQSDSLRNIPAKEKMAEIARRWKALDNSEKEEYVNKLQKIQEEYAEKYNEYINSLSPEEREEEESKMKSKKKLPNQVKVEVVPEPQKPPIDAVELLRLKKEHTWKKKSKEDPLAFATKKWNKLSDNQKKAYIRELKEINEEYIDNFGKFLQQCSPDKITEYLNLILQHKKDFQDVLSDSLRDIPSREKIIEIARRWKALDNSEKEECVNKLQKIQEEYTEKYNEYIKSLSPAKSEQEESEIKSKDKLPIIK